MLLMVYQPAHYGNIMSPGWHLRAVLICGSCICIFLHWKEAFSGTQFDRYVYCMRTKESKYHKTSDKTVYSRSHVSEIEMSYRWTVWRVFTACRPLTTRIDFYSVPLNWAQAKLSFIAKTWDLREASNDKPRGGNHIWRLYVVWRSGAVGGNACCRAKFMTSVRQTAKSRIVLGD